MFKSACVVVALGASLAGCAANRQAGLVEQGYERGALGVAAIGREDWAVAERSLTKASGTDASDPARLINLGWVYMETGRRADALSAWRRALAAERPFDVETIGGEVISTAALARRALARHGESAVQTAAVDTSN